MSISHYIKEIGCGKEGVSSLSREQAADLLGQVLDSAVTDLEVGAFCLAMRNKGETPQEMAGFLDDAHARLQRFPALTNSAICTIVLPSYNGARKLLGLSPLLALLLAREGLAVLVHGTATESTRVLSSDVLLALNIPALTVIAPIEAGIVVFAPTELLSPGLKRLLNVRRLVDLRNPTHSLIKLINPCLGKAFVVSSYTHPGYAISMAQTLALMKANALLLRGTEGEVVADDRRTPPMDGYPHGQHIQLQPAQSGTLVRLPNLPKAIDAASTAAYIQSILSGADRCLQRSRGRWNTSCI